MGKPTGFLEYERQEVAHRPVSERVGDFRETDIPLAEDKLLRQAARCMDCGVPFCHGIGCPLENRIPEFNDLVYRGRWAEACQNLHSTNNFPEITGRVCPALCEASCTLNINDDPVTIKHIELQIVERGFAEGWIRPQPTEQKTGKRVAIIGSGPAGLAAAQQLARTGHDVIVFEKSNRPGGLLRYGIPDFKLEKHLIDRRLEQLLAEGVQFETGVTIGEDISVRYLRRMFDAILLTMGAETPRGLAVPGRDFDNVHFAMKYLTQQNRILAGENIDHEELISAKGKTVVIIGGGDTGSDCAGTAVRQGAKEVHLFEIMPKPPEKNNPETPWPDWPRILRTSTSHEEGCRRKWSVLVKQLSASDVYVNKLHACRVQWNNTPDGWKMKELPDTDFSMKVDLVLVAMGFTHVVHGGLIKTLELKLDGRGNVATGGDFMTSEKGIFAAGDTNAGASLVVRAIDSGRRAAIAIDQWLKQK